MSKSAIVIGAGIVGLATARALGIRGYKVKVLERTSKAVGASIRNFGMIWPIGQPAGTLYERAILSKNIWKQVCDEANIWYDEVGSLHMAYSLLEQNVLEEFYEDEKKERGCELLNANETNKRSGAVVNNDLKFTLFSKDEIIVDPRIAIERLPHYLNKKFGVEFIWDSGVTKVNHPNVWCGKNMYEADEIFICNGADFETLFPEEFSAIPITKSKLQMMRTSEQPGNWRIGPALCGGLSLIHYKSFEAAASINLLKKHFENEMPEYMKWGIHVMISQNEKGEIIIGDSHEYGKTFEPFDRHFINELILGYLGKLAKLKNDSISESWNGIYSKLNDGSTELILKPQNGVTIINGLGGAGMTLSFGLCEQLISGVYKPTNSIIPLL